MSMIDFANSQLRQITGRQLGKQICPVCNGTGKTTVTINGKEYKLDCEICGGWGYLDHPEVLG